MFFLYAVNFFTTGTWSKVQKLEINIKSIRTSSFKAKFAERNDINEVGYYVVTKLSPRMNNVEFAAVNDARLASAQERWNTSIGKLKSLGAGEGAMPVKVVVSTLGKVVKVVD